MHAVETRTIAKVSKRLVPFLIVCYFVAYLDRVNVGFAALTMNQDLGLLLLAALGIIAAGIVLMLGHDDSLEHATAAAE
jgi:sugar phosphate permease